MRRVKYWIEFIVIFFLNALMYWYLGGYFNLLLGVAMILFLGTVGGLGGVYDGDGLGDLCGTGCFGAWLA